MLARHYAPRTPLELVAGSGRGRAVELSRAGLRVGWVALETAEELPGVVQVVMPDEPGAYAARLYAVLHELDVAGLDRIVVTSPPATETWLAIRDRLRRAAAPP
jgi:L-threonylcarbamoyladenylate synthase